MVACGPFSFWPVRMPAEPKVTVFIPVHNREDYICVAVNSILAQTFSDFELLIVDDGSSDGTIEVLERYQDPRLRIERNPENLGIPATRNHGLDKARGEYIALLDSDDHAFPNRLHTQVRFLDANPDIAQIGSWCSFMDEHGQPIRKVRKQPLDPDDVKAHMLFHCPLVNRTVMARTRVLRQYRYREEFPRCQDYDLHSRMIGEQRMGNLGQVLVCGREHPGRFTGQTEGLGKDRKKAIYRSLLAKVDIDATDDDLERHHGLTREDDRTLPADDYLDWAEAWLWRLLQANRQQPYFPLAAFKHAIGAVWALNCWQAGKAMGRRRVLARLLRSRLSRGLPGNLDASFLFATLRNMPEPKISDQKPKP